MAVQTKKKPGAVYGQAAATLEAGAAKKKEARPKCPTGQMYDVNVKKCVKAKNHKVEK